MMTMSIKSVPTLMVLRSFLLRSSTRKLSSFSSCLIFTFAVIFAVTEFGYCAPSPSLKFFGPSHSSGVSHPRQPAFASFLNTSSLTKSIQDATAQPTGESHEYTRHLREVLENEKVRHN